MKFTPINKRYFYRTINDILPNYLKWYHFLVIFLISLLLITLRRPDIFIYPQFWAEDGIYWFKNAYNGPILKTFITPLAGYLQTISRLAGAIATLFPIKFAPLVFNLLAIIIKILPILFIFSKRFNKTIPNLWVKISIALIYIAIPNTSEIFVNITNSQFHLALLLILIFIAESNKKLHWIIFDTFFIALSCLSGPFCIFLIPSIILKYILSSKHEKKSSSHLYLIFCIFAGLQLIAMFMGNIFISRQQQEVRYSLDILIKLITGQIYIGSLIGRNGYVFFLNQTRNLNIIFTNILIYSIFIVGTSIMIFSFITGKKEFKIFLVFCLTTFAAALIKPMVPIIKELSQWQIMSRPGNATRYYFLPMLAFLISCIHLLAKKNPLILKLLGLFIFSIFLFGLKFEFFYTPWIDYRYRDQINEFEKIPPGMFMDIQTLPQEYKMRLYKK